MNPLLTVIKLMHITVLHFILIRMQLRGC